MNFVDPFPILLCDLSFYCLDLGVILSEDIFADSKYSALLRFSTLCPNPTFNYSFYNANYYTMSVSFVTISINYHIGLSNHLLIQLMNQLDINRVENLLFI